MRVWCVCVCACDCACACACVRACTRPVPGGLKRDSGLTVFLTIIFEYFGSLFITTRLFPEAILTRVLASIGQNDVIRICWSRKYYHCLFSLRLSPSLHSGLQPRAQSHFIYCINKYLENIQLNIRLPWITTHNDKIWHWNYTLHKCYVE